MKCTFTFFVLFHLLIVGSARGNERAAALNAACTSDPDDGIGIFLRKLAELGLQEKTLVVLTSDNGGTRQALREPRRGNKGWYYEGGNGSGRDSSRKSKAKGSAK